MVAPVVSREAAGVAGMAAGNGGGWHGGGGGGWHGGGHRGGGWHGGGGYYGHEWISLWARRLSTTATVVTYGYGYPYYGYGLWYGYPYYGVLWLSLSLGGRGAGSRGQLRLQAPTHTLRQLRHGAAPDAYGTGGYDGADPYANGAYPPSANGAYADHPGAYAAHPGAAVVPNAYNCDGWRWDSVARHYVTAKVSCN